MCVCVCVILHWKFWETKITGIFPNLICTILTHSKPNTIIMTKFFFCFSENEKWKWKSLSRVQLFATPWTVQFMEFSRPEYRRGQPFHSPGDLPNPGIKPRSLTLQADSLPAEPQRKPKIPGVGSLSFIQQILLTQELNCGLLHCRRILYQLSYEGSPFTYYIFCCAVLGCLVVFDSFQH